MMSWRNPALNARVALRYSLLCFPICIGLTAVGVTDRAFLITSSCVNAWLAREAWKFYRLLGAAGSARGLFWASVWHLPAVLGLAMLHKEGMWKGVWRGLVGGHGEEDEEEYQEEEEEEWLN